MKKKPIIILIAILILSLALLTACNPPKAPDPKPSFGASLMLSTFASDGHTIERAPDGSYVYNLGTLFYPTANLYGIDGEIEFCGNSPLYTYIDWYDDGEGHRTQFDIRNPLETLNKKVVMKKGEEKTFNVNIEWLIPFVKAGTYKVVAMLAFYLDGKQEALTQEYLITVVSGTGGSAQFFPLDFGNGLREFPWDKYIAIGDMALYPHHYMKILFSDKEALQAQFANTYSVSLAEDKNGWERDERFSTLINGYNDAFFENKQVVTFIVTAGGGGYMFALDSSEYDADNGRLFVKLKQISLGIGHEALVRWLAVVEIDKIPAGSEIMVTINDAHLPDGGYLTLAGTDYIVNLNNGIIAQSSEPTEAVIIAEQDEAEAIAEIAGQPEAEEVTEQVIIAVIEENSEPTEAVIIVEQDETEVIAEVTAQPEAEVITEQEEAELSPEITEETEQVTEEITAEVTEPNEPEATAEVTEQDEDEAEIIPEMTEEAEVIAEVTEEAEVIPEITEPTTPETIPEIDEQALLIAAEKERLFNSIFVKGEQGYFDSSIDNPDLFWEYVTEENEIRQHVWSFKPIYDENGEIAGYYLSYDSLLFIGKNITICTIYGQEVKFMDVYIREKAGCERFSYLSYCRITYGDYYLYLFTEQEGFWDLAATWDAYKETLIIETEWGNRGVQF